ncbi:2-aminoethanethiol dioxygenase-like [Cololabis saira]|uniref:2-aminoethanethiol dioxygenase-like n=1 Tax=Cololabis saira TaxID=129043 RepID=UPI002AD2667F|nr:2-aminoethanethiol dioxygenase-like [Cololabis saira]
MMPADGPMSSLVQRIARQALATFRSPGDGSARSFLENHDKLRGLMTEVRSSDLNLAADARPRGGSSTRGGGAPRPPVSYMHICETDHFSMGVFLLQSGACIPLHDHPGMHGVLKVLYGKARIRCFDRLQLQQIRPMHEPGSSMHPLPEVPAAQVGALRRSVLRSCADYTELSGPCVLEPERDNLHQIHAVDGPAAFMDILAPPYDPDQGRDCHYFREVEVGGVEVQEQGQEVWLMEISQPPDFWCGGEPYPGPEVQL